ncbi:mechanosensitive ion channel [Chelativorans composti]|uniref:Mechanosensitive ion channel family protein n=1 Tax=Chelativorans composti TaxID=768533 RepID=A0ABW5DCK4_9HYPH
MEELLQEGAVQVEAIAGARPDWLILTLVLGGAVCAALLVHSVLMAIFRRLVGRQDEFWRKLLDQSSSLICVGLILFSLALAVPLAPLSDTGSTILRHVLTLGFIGVLTRIAQLALQLFVSLHLRRISKESKDELMTRKHVTQTRILQRIGTTVILVIGISAMLMTFDPVRQYGISLLASAGAASLVVGLSLQPMLKNVFAGIQLAITQPIRIDDSIQVQGETGTVEEITSTYVVVRTWDGRRMILPLNYFIEQPFLNMSRKNTSVTAVAIMNVDYSTPVDALRQKARELVEASPLWDRKSFAVTVTNLKETKMEVRITAGAKNSSAASELAALLREQLVTYLVENHPRALPLAALPSQQPPLDSKTKSPASS